MATSQPTEIPTEGEVDVNEAVKEILAEMEAEEQDRRSMQTLSSLLYTIHTVQIKN